MSRKFIFIHIPKCGGFGVGKKLLEQKDNIIYNGHKTALQYEQEGYSSNTFKMFGLIRNPYDRIVSAYFYLLKGGKKNKRDLSYQKIVRNYVSFQDFILSIRKDSLVLKIV